MVQAREESFHDEGGQSRAGKEGDTHEMDDVRVAEAAQQLAFLHELAGNSMYLRCGYLVAV